MFGPLGNRLRGGGISGLGAVTLGLSLVGRPVFYVLWLRCELEEPCLTDVGVVKLGTVIGKCASQITTRKIRYWVI